MARQALIGGAYTARSVIASAQRCVNLYPEANPTDAPFPFTDYPTPGLSLLSSCPTPGAGRGVYLASNGELYAVVGSKLWLVSDTFVWTELGTLPDGSTPVSMRDNGLALVAVDGSSTGYAVDLSTHAFGIISGDNFYGATSVGYADTYFVFNRPGTRQFYLSLSNASYDLLVGTGVVDGTIFGGTNYKNGIAAADVTAPGSGYSLPLIQHPNQDLAGGTGEGAKGLIETEAGVVTSIDFLDPSTSNPGHGYVIGDVLTWPGGAGTGAQFTVTILTVGTKTYANIALTGGSGTGARANITVSGGSVTAVSITEPGSGYVIGDVLSADSAQLGGGTGFTYTVTKVNSNGFDPLAIASKTGSADLLANLLIVHREVWLVGEQTTEVWYNAGAADFPYQIMPGVFIQQGTVAPYSLASADLDVFWLGQNPQGQTVVFMGRGYQATRISTHAIEEEFRQYRLSDAVGFTYQQDGHVFYVLNFGFTDRTWVYDVTTNLWHERASIDADGEFHRALPGCAVNAYGYNLALDSQTGKLYHYNLDAFDDNGAAVVRIRSFPHIKNEDKRVRYRSLVANFEVGTASGTTTAEPAQVSMRWSDNGGQSWGSGVPQSIGAAGQYRASVKWSRLGLARSRTFELSWSANVKTSLSGASIELEALGS